MPWSFWSTKQKAAIWPVLNWRFSVNQVKGDVSGHLSTSDCVKKPTSNCSIICRFQCGKSRTRRCHFIRWLDQKTNDWLLAGLRDFCRQQKSRTFRHRFSEQRLEHKDDIGPLPNLQVSSFGGNVELCDIVEFPGWDERVPFTKMASVGCIERENRFLSARERWPFVCLGVRKQNCTKDLFIRVGFCTRANRWNKNKKSGRPRKLWKENVVASAFDIVDVFNTLRHIHN